MTSTVDPIAYPPTADLIAAGYPLLPDTWSPPAQRHPLRVVVLTGTVLGRSAVWDARHALTALHLRDTLAEATRIVRSAAQTARTQLQGLELPEKALDAAAAVGECVLDVALTPLDATEAVLAELRHRWLVRRYTPTGIDAYDGRPCTCGLRWCSSYRWSGHGRAEYGDPLQPVTEAVGR